ncbi:MAG: O-antigen ligase family protein [Acidobacteriia bacterium]|nr:O-antigen ligase family protein [Terriglobia bacterium]
MTKFLHYSLLFILVAAPFAFGAVEPWAYGLMNALALGLLLLWSLERLWKKDLPPIAFPKTLMFMLGFLAVALLQLVRLPAAVVGFLSPAHISFLRQMNLGAFDSATTGSATLSLDPYLTSLAVVNLVCLLIYLFLFVQMLNQSAAQVRVEVDSASRHANSAVAAGENEEHSEQDSSEEASEEGSRHHWRRESTPPFLTILVFTIIIAGFVMALFGILEKLSGAKEIYWVRTLTHGGNLMGPFVNRDHFAGWLEMPFGLTLGLILFLRRRVPYWWLLAFSAVLMGTAILYSGSRGGMLCFAFQLVSAAILAFSTNEFNFSDSSFSLQAWRDSVRAFAPLLVIAGILVAVVLSIAYVGPDAVLGRLQDQLSADQRLPVWHDTLGIVKAYPLLGSGLGSFRTIFPHFQNHDYASRYLQAHNDYLQLLSETGIVGALLALAALFAVLTSGFLNCFHGSRFSIGARLGAILGILGLLLHSFFDFNLQIPSNALMFLVLCAVCLFR